MFDKVSRAFSLVGPCWRVLMLDKELLLFPVMSAIALVAVLVGGFIPLKETGVLDALTQNTGDGQQPDQQILYILLAFGFYFACYFVIVFFNAALIGCALIRFSGGNPTIADGFRLSFKNLPQITAWALVSASVGVVLQLLESRLQGLARLLTGLLGAAWSVATFFAVPILVVDGVGPTEALKRSVEAIRKTWGESLVSHAGFGVLSGLATLVVMPVFYFVGQLAPTSPEVAIGLAVMAIIWVLLANLVISTLSTIMRAALYIYAVEGEVPDQFDSQLMRDSFGPT